MRGCSGGSLSRNPVGARGEAMRAEADARPGHRGRASLGVRLASPYTALASLSTPPRRAWPHRLCTLVGGASGAPTLEEGRRAWPHRLCTLVGGASGVPTLGGKALTRGRARS